MNKVSIVTSLYKSAPYVADFYKRHLDCIQQRGVDYEFVFVDDGSPDNSADKVRELVEKDSKVKLVLFSRNFGQYPAMFAAMANATGDWVYTADCDMEEPPENILTMFDILKKDPGIDFLYGVARERSGGIAKAIFGGFFYRFMAWGADVHIPKNMSWQLMMNRKYLDTLMMFKEAETLPAGLMMLAGFKQASFEIDKGYKGSTTYTLKKRLRLAFNSITAFSSKPLVFIGIMGIVITLISFLAIIAAILVKFFYLDYQAGWASVILSIWLVGGLILSSVGVIGIYLAKIFNQIKNRPLYIIKDVVTQENCQQGQG